MLDMLLNWSLKTVGAQIIDCLQLDTVSFCLIGQKGLLGPRTLREFIMLKSP